MFNWLRYKLAQFIYPHKCPPLPTVLAHFEGGISHGKEWNIVGIPNVVVVPRVEKVGVVPCYLKDDTLTIPEGYITTHTYRLRYAVYDYEERP